jgi:hypothetical protein
MSVNSIYMTVGSALGKNCPRHTAYKSPAKFYWERNAGCDAKDFPIREREELLIGGFAIDSSFVIELPHPHSDFARPAP